MKNLLIAAAISEVFAVIFLFGFTYLYPRPPVFTHNIADPIVGPAWFQKWRTTCDEHLFLNSWVIGYADPPTAAQIAWVKLRYEQINSVFWLAYLEECARNSPIFLGSGLLIPLLRMLSHDASDI